MTCVNFVPHLIFKYPKRACTNLIQMTFIAAWDTFASTNILLAPTIIINLATLPCQFSQLVLLMSSSRSRESLTPGDERLGARVLPE